MDNSYSDNNPYIRSLALSNRLTEIAIRNAVVDLGLTDNSRILDVPCGIGNHSVWFAEANSTYRVTGVDLAENHIERAKQKVIDHSASNRVRFKTGDITALPFDDDTFDCVWCADGLWLGPSELGCVAEEPYGVLNEFARVTRNGGTIALVFWSGQRFLPGYPLLESALNATFAANQPLSKTSTPESRATRAAEWLLTLGMENVQIRSYVTDLQGPLDDITKAALNNALAMFYAKAESEVSQKIWREYQSLLDPESSRYIFNLRGYSGYIIYTVYSAENRKKPF